MAQGWCNVCDGLFTSNSRAPANLEQLLPDWRDASTWNWNAMAVANPATGYTGFRDYNVTIGNMSYEVHREIYAGWYQDDWKASSKLTLNLGVRYDVDHGAQGEWVKFLPWLSGQRPTDKNNFAPRTGFAYAINDRSVIRGGYGLFFTELEDDALHQSYILTQNANITLPNNGRRTSAPTVRRTEADPRTRSSLGGATSSGCRSTRRTASRSRSAMDPEIPVGDHHRSYSHMVSVGFQRELATNIRPRLATSCGPADVRRAAAEPEQLDQPGDRRQLRATGRDDRLGAPARSRRGVRLPARS
jgi:hypothetical protein